MWETCNFDPLHYLKLKKSRKKRSIWETPSQESTGPKSWNVTEARVGWRAQLHATFFHSVPSSLTGTCGRHHTVAGTTLHPGTMGAMPMCVGDSKCTVLCAKCIMMVWLLCHWTLLALGGSALQTNREAAAVAYCSFDLSAHFRGLLQDSENRLCALTVTKNTHITTLKGQVPYHYSMGGWQNRCINC